jgi:hypothetical protein
MASVMDAMPARELLLPPHDAEPGALLK